MNVIAYWLGGLVFFAAVIMTILQIAKEEPLGFWIFVVVIIAIVTFVYVRRKQKDAHPWNF